MDIPMEFEYKDESKTIVKSLKCRGEILELESGETLE